MLILAGICIGVYEWNKPAKKAEDIKGIQITATALSKDYNANEKNADTKYLNKDIEVSGTINEVDNNQDGGVMIVLQTDDPSTGIQCSLRDKGATASKGQNVTIKGFCSGNGITGVSLTSCVIKQ
jgi:tRNA_anti-like